jgi:hypothetical protein
VFTGTDNLSLVIAAYCFRIHALELLCLLLSGCGLCIFVLHEKFLAVSCRKKDKLAFDSNAEILIDKLIS